MQTTFINSIRDRFEDLVISNNLSNVQRAELGFVNDSCEITRAMLMTICFHCVQNFDIFNDEQSANIINIINKLSYDK